MSDTETRSPLRFAVKAKAEASPMQPWKILVADDEPEVHHVTKLVLDGKSVFGRPIEILSAFSGEEAKAILRDRPDIACILLDVVMERDDSGLDVVKFIRDELCNKNVRIILRTGQPGQAPESQVILEYEINDYKQKTDLTVEKLFSAVVTAIRSYRDIVSIEQSRKGMEMIISASADMLRPQSIMRFAAGVLNQIISLMYISHDALYLRARGSGVSGLTVKEDGDTMRILAGAGKYTRFEESDFPDGLREDQVGLIRRAVETQSNVYEGGTFVIVLKGREGVQGILFLEDCPPLAEIDIDLITIFCNNVSEAFANIVLYEELEEKVEQRTKELKAANEELKAAQARMLRQEKMASIGQLAAGIAHEINNPLSFIISNLNTLEGYAKKVGAFCDAIPNDDTIGFICTDIDALVDESLGGAKRVQKIVQSLRLFSAVDTPGTRLVDVNSSLEMTIEVMGSELQAKADIEKRFGDIPSTLCDPSQLGIVFMNVLKNAAQAIAGRGTISVDTSCEDGEHIVIRIRDTGVGIPKDRLDRIFDPFYTTRDVGQGLGLGLTIAYDIIHGCGGAIDVQSEVGKGSCFIISLPANQEASDGPKELR
jgi:Signal transduction histidine kinase regulating C4-dicarboxylate transport system